MDSITCCYLFGHKDLVESHLKQQHTWDAGEVRDTRGWNTQGQMTADLFNRSEELMNPGSQSPVKILINMVEAYWLEVKYAHCSWYLPAQNGAIMFDNVQWKPFNQREVLFCWILNTGSILHVSREFIKLKNIIASNWLTALISINMIQ